MSMKLHPRLFINQDQLKELRIRINTEPEISQNWQIIKEQADSLLTEKLISEAYADADYSQHGNYGAPSRQISSMGEILGFVYQVIGDVKYANKLKEALLYYCDYKKWFGKGCLDFDPPWHSELNTAHFCFGFALGYDYIHDILTTSERHKIIRAVVDLGIVPLLSDWLWPDTRVHALDSMGHNWWSVCISQAGLAALAISRDYPEALEWVEEVSEAFPTWFKYQGNVLQNKSRNFDRNGLFYEGINYANYGVGEYLLFRIAYINCFGKGKAPEIPILAKVGNAYIQTSYPTSNGLDFVNFNDGHTIAGRCAKLLLAVGFDNPQLRWYVAKSNEKLSTIDLINADKIFKGPKQRPQIEMYNDGEFPDVGWAVFRSSWEDDATLVAIKSGFTWNHAHADASSIILNHKGQRLIVDGGNCSYGRKEYLDYYCQSQAHNVVLFNGKGQNRRDLRRGVKTPGMIHDYLQLDNIRYVYADVTGPTSEHFFRNYRHILWVGNVILIIDDLLSHKQGKIEWLLHYADQAVFNGNTLTLINGGAKIDVEHLYPQAIHIEEIQAPAADAPDKLQTYFSFSPQEQDCGQKFITAISLVDGDIKPQVQLVTTSNTVIGVSIQDRDLETEVYFNLNADGRKMHRNSSNQLGKWDTDAYLLAVTYPKCSDFNDPSQINNVFMSSASYLRYNEKVLYSCLAKASVVISKSENKNINQVGRLVIRGHVDYPVLFKFDQKLDELVVNDRSISFDYDQRTSLVKFFIPKQD